jgi:hypothetical protein
MRFICINKRTQDLKIRAPLYYDLASARACSETSEYNTAAQCSLDIATVARELLHIALSIVAQHPIRHKFHSLSLLQRTISSPCLKTTLIYFVHYWPPLSLPPRLLSSPFHSLRTPTLYLTTSDEVSHLQDSLKSPLPLCRRKNTTTNIVTVQKEGEDCAELTL